MTKYSGSRTAVLTGMVKPMYVYFSTDPAPYRKNPIKK